jgi:adenylate kinase
LTSVTATRYLILLGAPGAGKGTQAGVLSKALDLPHMASGDVFRAVRQEQSDLGELVRSYYDKGLLVPDEVTIRVILSVLSRDEYARGAMLDGFPRTIDQAQALDAELRGSGRSIWRVAYLEVATEELMRRLSGRWLCRGCSSVYHEINNPPRKAGTCDNCGGELYQRVDDSAETVRTRLATFMRETEPLVNYYEAQGKLCRVNGDQPVDAVTRSIEACVEAGC